MSGRLLLFGIPYLLAAAPTARAATEGEQCGGIAPQERREFGCDSACRQKALRLDLKAAFEPCLQQCRACYPPRLLDEDKFKAGLGVGAVGVAAVAAGLGLFFGLNGQPTAGSCPLIGLDNAGCQYNRWPGTVTLLAGALPLVVGGVLISLGVRDWNKKKSP